MVVLAVGMYAYMLIVPFAEAAEQTVLQRVVPYERQGRVFGFAQSVEQAASPFTAFLIGPVTQFAVVPFMSGDGAGAVGGGARRPVGGHRVGRVVQLMRLSQPDQAASRSSFLRTFPVDVRGRASVNSTAPGTL